MIENVEQANLLHVALSLSKHAEDPFVAFWKLLKSIDKDGELLGNAFVITAQIYGEHGLIEALTELHIRDGQSVYNRIQGGIFETVHVTDDQKEYPEFYIYSVEDYIFE